MTCCHISGIAVGIVPFCWCRRMTLLTSSRVSREEPAPGLGSARSSIYSAVESVLWKCGVTFGQILAGAWWSPCRVWWLLAMFRTRPVQQKTDCMTFLWRVSGGIGIPGAVIGILLGGYLLKRFQLKPKGKFKKLKQSVWNSWLLALSERLKYSISFCISMYMSPVWLTSGQCWSPTNITKREKKEQNNKLRWKQRQEWCRTESHLEVGYSLRLHLIVGYLTNNTHYSCIIIIAFTKQKSAREFMHSTFKN